MCRLQDSRSRLCQCAGVGERRIKLVACFWLVYVLELCADFIVSEAAAQRSILVGGDGAPLVQENRCGVVCAVL